MLRLTLWLVIFLMLGVFVPRVAVAGAFSYQDCANQQFGELSAQEQDGLCRCMSDHHTAGGKTQEALIEGASECFSQTIKPKLDTLCNDDEDMRSAFGKRLPKFCTCLSSTVAKDTTLFMRNALEGHVAQMGMNIDFSKVITQDLLELNMKSATDYCVEKL